MPDEPAPDQPEADEPAPDGRVPGEPMAEGPAPDRPEPERLLAAAAGGDRRALARCCSLVERGGEVGRRIGAAAYRRAGDDGWVIGLTGAPGAGKSTLTGRLVGMARAQGWEVGVVAVDPSSPYSGGALLGDRVRMDDHFTDPGVFIRSMATRGHLGGLATAAPALVRVLVAAGFGLVLVETVGVGQVELEVASSADTTVVVVHPRWGDAIQANKAGLLEVADVLVVNKADQPGAAETARELAAMVALTGTGRGGAPGGWQLGQAGQGGAPGGWRPPVELRQAGQGGGDAGWRPPIVRTSAVAGEGTEELWTALAAHREHLAATGELAARRQARRAGELAGVLAARIDQRVRSLEGGARYRAALDAVAAGELDPYQAAEQLLDEAFRPR